MKRIERRAVEKLPEYAAAVSKVMRARARVKEETTMKHPMQAIERDSDGIARFKANAIVEYLLERVVELGVDMNTLARLDFAREDRAQFAQLIGYSVSGFGDLSYADEETVQAADAEAQRLAT
jgi:hypothetical protein